MTWYLRGSRAVASGKDAQPEPRITTRSRSVDYVRMENVTH